MQGVQAHHDLEGECRQYALRNVGLTAFLVRSGFIHANSRILDIGAGAGHVAMAIRSAFPKIDITCVEADPLAYGWLKKSGLTTQKGLEDCTGSFDSIYMIEVLEHVDDPIAVLKAINKVLARDGKLFITTPCGQATSGRIVQEAFETPEHVHFFTEKSLDLALRSAGYEAPKFRTLRHMYHVRGGRAVFSNVLKDIARYARAKILGQHQLITFVGRAPGALGEGVPIKQNGELGEASAGTRRRQGLFVSADHALLVAENRARQLLRFGDLWHFAEFFGFAARCRTWSVMGLVFREQIMSNQGNVVTATASSPSTKILEALG